MHSHLRSPHKTACLTLLESRYAAETYYYVIDAHSDIPDAKFGTYAEAATYQKEYAEYHDYVIVKLDDTYNIYNMEPTN